MASGTGSSWMPRLEWPDNWASRGTKLCGSIWPEFAASALTADIAVPKASHRGGNGAGHSQYLRARAEHSDVVARAGVCGNYGDRPISSSASMRSTTAAIPIAARNTSRPSINMANLATKAGVEGTLRFKIHTPLIKMTKAEIIRRGTELGVDYASDPHLLRSRIRRRSLRPVRCLPARAGLKGFRRSRI